MANSGGRQDANREHRQEDTVVSTELAPVYHGSASSVAVSVHQHTYSRKAVLSAAYKLSDRCAILIDVHDERWILYVLTGTPHEAMPLVEILVKELTDQALRDELEKEFGAVRTLLVAQAFSEGNLLDPQRDDADDSADPQGTRQRR
jgi:His-Xaa-Ser system protein HxsD